MKENREQTRVEPDKAGRGMKTGVTDTKTEKVSPVFPQVISNTYSLL